MTDNDNVQQKPHLRLVARSDAKVDITHHRQRCPAPFLTSVQWTADGTVALADTSDHSVHAYVLPDDLLDHEDTRHLSPQATTKLPEPSQTTVPAPFFSLRDPATQTFLSGCRDHPIQLYAAFPPDDEHAPTPLATYKLIKAETEAFITPASLLWDDPGTHFLTGSLNRLDLFDLSGHASDGPVTTVPTAPSRGISHESGVGMKGVVSALSSTSAASSSPTIAAGTWSRSVGLYDLHRTDKTIANWSLAQAPVTGQGVAQTIWSPCGRYLVVNERHAPGLLVYDIRVTGQLLAVLAGRTAQSQQRLRCDVYQGAHDAGFELWAGDYDGSLNAWTGVGLHGDLDAQPTWSWSHHEAPVGVATLHPSGSVLATCSGGWKHRRAYDSDSDSDSDCDGTGPTVLDESSLKIWSIE